MSQTLTVTKETLKIIEERLSLKDPVVIGLPPTQSNIVYKVQKLLKPDEFCEILSCDLLQKQENYPKTIIFCHSYSYCSDLYKSMRIKWAVYGALWLPRFTSIPFVGHVHKSMHKKNE